MTEAEWLEATDPYPMMWFLQDRASDRKTRLFTVACCRTVENELIDEGIHLLDACEAISDCSLGWRELAAGREAAKSPSLYGQADFCRSGTAGHAALRAVIATAWGKGVPSVEAAAHAISLCFEARRHSSWKQAPRLFSTYLREIFGNPFRPVIFIPSWLTFDVRMIATGAYEDKAFSRLPILADALQDAGCDNEDILSHLRGGGPHVRGCWALDLVLGKS